MQLKHLAKCIIYGKESVHHKTFYAVDDDGDDGDSDNNDHINSHFRFSQVKCPTLNRQTTEYYSLNQTKISSFTGPS